MSSLISYRGLSVLNSASGAGGAAINNDLIYLADRSVPYIATTDPGTSNNASSSPPFYAGSRWINTSSSAEWVCIASSSSTATWEKNTVLYQAPGSGTAIQASLSGNTRGSSAVDLQLSVIVSSHVASGDESFAAGGGNTASGINSCAIGASNVASGGGSMAVGIINTASGYFSTVSGYFNTSSGIYSTASGYFNTASGANSVATGHKTTASANYSLARGYFSTAAKMGQIAAASGSPTIQYTTTLLFRSTTDATQTELSLDGNAPSGTSEPTSNRFIVISGKSYACQIRIAARKSDGTSALFCRMAIIKNVSGTVSLEGSPQTIGVDINPASWILPVIQADNTDKSLQILVQGVASTNIRWSAVIDASEIIYT